MFNIIKKNSASWLSDVLNALHYNGFALLGEVLEPAFISSAREALYTGFNVMSSEVGESRLKQAGELGVLRLPMKFDPFFFRFLQIEELLRVIDATVSETCILHLQNGFILPSFSKGPEARVFQNQFHPDFPRYLNGYVASINTFFALDEFTSDNGALLVVPGTHQQAKRPDEDYMVRNAVPVICPAGTMVVFDSTLWHSAGINRSNHDRLAVNHQFTRSFIKQQIDYVRALGEDVVLNQPPRTQQLLGYYTRVVTSLGEYYQPEERRLYRKGQG